MEILLIVAFVAVALFGWVLILFGLPGTLLILAAAAGYALAANFEIGDARVLITLGGLSLLAELLEFVVTYASARRAKVPADVTTAAITGGVIGALIGVPIAFVGSLLGMFIGLVAASFFFALYKEPNVKRAWALAKACLISRTLALGVKALIGVIMLVYAFWAI